MTKGPDFVLERILLQFLIKYNQVEMTRMIELWQKEVRKEEEGNQKIRIDHRKQDLKKLYENFLQDSFLYPSPRVNRMSLEDDPLKI